MQTPTLEPAFSDMQVAGICKMCALESGAAQAIAAYRERLIAARDAEWQPRVEKLEAALDYAIACLPDAPLNAKEKLRAALGRE